ncbi:MAG: hypothetical protein J5981_05065 [Lachnospira sp.]|nr:hypothetical protein [Lachnospira sp.]
MKKMKKILALALAFVLAVTILPMVGSKEAKAASIPGYYRWYMDRSGKSQFVTEGTPVVSGLTGFVVPSGNSTLYASDYTNAIVEGKAKYISVTSHGATNKYERSCRLNDGTYVTFTAPCDGTIEMCYKPGGKNNQKSTYLTVNDEQVGETITLDTDKGSTYSYLAADEKWVYEMSVEEGESYKIAAPNDIALSQIIFEPSPVSALGASYRNATDEYTNGIRFGSTIDKTKIDYNNVTESGTLIARKTTIDSNCVT